MGFGVKGSKWRAGYKCTFGCECILKEGHHGIGTPEGVCNGKVPCAVSTCSLCICACVCGFKAADVLTGAAEMDPAMSRNQI